MASQQKIRYMTQLSLLIAIQIILAVTPLGYIKINPSFDLTIMHIPVIIGGFALGIKAGAVLGTVFGLTSIFVATFRGDMTAFLFSPFISWEMFGNLYSILIAMAPRILMGLFAALVFKALRPTKLPVYLSAGVSAAVGSLTNTILVLGGVYLFYGKPYAELLGISLNALLGVFIATISLNGVLEALFAVLVAAALVKPLERINRVSR